MLAHNSVDRSLMARDSIELNLDETTLSPGKSSRVRNNQQSTLISQPDRDERPQSRAAALLQQRRARTGVRNEGDSELLINPDDLDLEELDNEEAQFLRTDRRVPVRRNAIPKKTANQLKLAGTLAAVLVVGGGITGWAYSYGMHASRFRLESSDAVEVSGVHNASREHVMEVAAADIGRNIFFIPLDERKRQLEQLPWVEQATVMRLLPNRIAVRIEERTPVAFAQIGPHISLIDANGVVMGLPADRKIKYSFPVIRGIAETEPLSSRAAAMKIYNRLVSDLSGGGPDDPKAQTNYLKQLSEVDLSDPEDVKVTANDPGGTVMVHLGSENFLQHYKLYVAHIAEWRQQFPNLQSIDCRYEGQVVVNPDRPAVVAKSPVKPSPLMAMAAPKSLPRLNAGSADKKKTLAKAAVKPANHKVAKPVNVKAKAVNTKAVKKKTSPLTQRAQR
ncbi:MAG TPA: FtsQ-type POTRA domain-containing protein [Candidatus Angelobacter sp.]|nr:FtsQ-type POTRA domain-containing protein [Candidatus Angelobacter sp.]